VGKGQIEQGRGNYKIFVTAYLKNDLARHNLTLEYAIELALNKPLWRLLAASGAMH